MSRGVGRGKKNRGTNCLSFHFTSQQSRPFDDNINIFGYSFIDFEILRHFGLSDSIPAQDFIPDENGQVIFQFTLFLIIIVGFDKGTGQHCLSAFVNLFFVTDVMAERGLQSRTSRSTKTFPMAISEAVRRPSIFCLVKNCWIFGVNRNGTASVCPNSV